MKHSLDVIKMAQSILNEKNLHVGNVDGIIGNNTINALNKLRELPNSWTLEMKITGLIQGYAKNR